MNKWHVKANKIRKAKRITLLSIADRLGVSEGAVSHYFSGRRVPEITKIARIAAMLEVSLSELVENDPYFLHSKDERQIVDLFRQIPESQHEAALKMLTSLTKKD